MIHLYNFIPDFAEIRSKCTIDMSKIPSDQLADECERVLQHHKTCILFIGFLEPGWMLDPKHEARIRLAVRKFESHIVALHLESLPYSWKNEIDTLYSRKAKDGEPQVINDGCAVHTESKTEDRCTS
jgi:hypothetical protein